MYLSNQKGFDIFTVQNIFMKHEYFKILQLILWPMDMLTVTIPDGTFVTNVYHEK